MYLFMSITEYLTNTLHYMWEESGYLSWCTESHVTEGLNRSEFRSPVVIIETFEEDWENLLDSVVGQSAHDCPIGLSCCSPHMLLGIGDAQDDIGQDLFYIHFKYLAKTDGKCLIQVKS